MNPSQTLETTLWIQMLLQTIGAVDMPGAGPRKLPSPAAYASSIAVWTILGFAADSGPSGARAARSFAWVLILANLALGTAGKALVRLLNDIGSIYRPATSTAQPSVAAPGAAGPTYT
jgi:hypothetical protein